MSHIILFDADGMVLKQRRYFSEYYAETKGIAVARITPFFTSVFQDCLVGKADLKEELGKRLVDWEWSSTVEELLDMWFAYEGTIDEQITKHVADLRAQGIQCYIHTNNEQYRTEHIWNKAGLKNYFDGIFSSSEIGYKKPQQEFWQTIYTRLALRDKKDVLVWDDEKANVESARAFGYDARLYIGFDDYIKQ